MTRTPAMLTRDSREGKARTTPSRNGHQSLRHLTLLILLGLSGARASHADEIPGPPEAESCAKKLVREIYVPHEELLKIATKDPSGVVMTLAEYRALLDRARENIPVTDLTIEPPPVKAKALQAVIRGELRGDTVYFRAEIEIGVAVDGWVRCYLGPAPPFLGRITLDGAPAWGLVETEVGSPAQKKSRVDHAPRHLLSLILRGVGTHRAILEFNLPVREVEDGWMVESTLPRTAASRLELDVPGRVIGDSSPGHLRSRFVTANGGSAHTVFELVLGTREHFRLHWKLERGEGRPKSILTAAHKVVYRLRARDPSFFWKTVVQIHHKKTDRVVLLSPRGARVLRVTGKHVHSFRELAPEEGAANSEEEGVRAIEILLKRPISGRVAFDLEGLIDSPEETRIEGEEGAIQRFRYKLGRPRSERAIRDYGFIVLDKEIHARFGEVNLVDMQAVARSEASLSGNDDLVTSEDWRHFAFSDPDARLDVQVEHLTARLRARSTHRFGIDASGGFAQSSFRVDTRQGRVYSLELRVPAGLRLTQLSERESGRGLSFELPVYGEAGAVEHSVFLDLATALGGSTELLFDARFELADFGGDTTWRVREGSLATPWLPEADLETTSVGVEVSSYLDPVIASLESWRTLEPFELAERGLNSSLLVAALERERTSGEEPQSLSIRLEKRPSRGVYQAVVHAEARDTILDVRVDVRLAVLGRPVEAVAFTLPVPADQPVEIEGPEIQEERSGADGRRFLVFQKPWIGERYFHCRFELPLMENRELDLPLIEVAPASRSLEFAPAGGNEDLGVFQARRFVVLRSRGGVELRVNQASDLVSISADEVPSFADMRSRARLVSTFRIQERLRLVGESSRIVTDVHPRRELLERGIAKLDLQTTIDRGGVSRTELSCVLKYAREQYLPIELEPGARILSVEVDGRLVRPVQDPAAQMTRLISLPTRSYATLRLVYERSSDALEGAGVWQERGPVFPGMPVGEVRWNLLHPPGLRVALRGQTMDSLSGQSVPTFVRTFWKPLFSLRYPRWTTIENLRLPPPGERESLSLDQIVSGGETSDTEDSSLGTLQQLISRQQLDRIESRRASHLSAFRVPEEGVRLEVRKLGSSPVVALHYEDPYYGRFLRTGIFVLAVLVGLVLRRGGENRWLLAYLFGGLSVGTFLPAALEWESQLFWIPFAEGLAFLSLFLVVSWLIKFLVRKRSFVFSRQASSRRVAWSIVILMLALFSVTLPGAVRGDEIASGANTLPCDDDAVLIPYALEDFHLPETPDKRQVYLPYQKFVELWNLAYPEDRVAVDEKNPPAEMVVGNANYELESDGNGFQLVGDLSIYVYTKKWTALPLAFSGVQLQSIEVDGVLRGVSYRDNVPFVPLQGVGEHTMRVVLGGKVEVGLAEARVTAGLVPGLATRVKASLPTGVDLETKGSATGAPVLVENGDRHGDVSRTRCRLDIGQDGRLTLVWRQPDLNSDRRVTMNSISMNAFQLDLDGYSIERRERVTIEGNEVRQLRYRVLGDWHVLGVRGAEVTDWTLVRASETEPESGWILEIIFSRRSQKFEFEVNGFAPCGSEEIAPAGLRLIDATRQEGFLGLFHHPLRRFPVDSLAGLERTSEHSLRQHFPPRTREPRASFDRLYHFHTDYGNARIRSVSTDADGSVESEFVGLVGGDRVAVAARVFQNVLSGPAPLEYRVSMPDSWDVISVIGAGVREWELRGDGASRELVVYLRERSVEREPIEWYAESPSPGTQGPLDTGVTFDFPSFRALSPLRQNVSWALASPSDLQLGEGEGTNMMSLSVYPRWLELDPGWDYRMGFQSRLEEARLQVNLQRKAAYVAAITTSIFRVESTHVDLNSRLDLNIRNAGLESFEIALPSDAGFINLKIPGQTFRRVLSTANSRTTLTVHLPTPVRGLLVAELSYRLDRGRDRGAVLVAPNVLGVQESLEYIGVLPHAVHALEVLAEQGLEEKFVTELADLPGFSFGPERLFKTYLVVDPDWRLVVTEDEQVIHEGREALVELAEIDTIYAVDGRNWTAATYTILNRSAQFLEFELPSGHVLWRVMVDGRPVVVSRRDDGEAENENVILVPVERVQETDLSLQITVVYTLPRSGLPEPSATLSPAAPRLLADFQTLETFWRVHIPKGYEVTDTAGNLGEVLGQMRHGKKVKGLMDQISRITTAGESAGQRGKKRARYNILQLEQALSDALEDIEKESNDTRNAAEQVDRRARHEQLVETRQWSRQGSDKLSQLKNERELRPEDTIEELDPVDQDFEDARVFMEEQLNAQHTWRSSRADVDGGHRDIRELRGQLAVSDVPERALSALEYQRSEPRRPSVDLEGLQFADVSPLDIEVPRGGRIFTYRRTAGDPRLQIEVASTTVHSPGLHWLGLFLSLAALAVWLRRTYSTG